MRRTNLTNLNRKVALYYPNHAGTTDLFPLHVKAPELALIIAEHDRISPVQNSQDTFLHNLSLLLLDWSAGPRLTWSTLFRLNDGLCLDDGGRGGGLASPV